MHYAIREQKETEKERKCAKMLSEFFYDKLNKNKGGQGEPIKTQRKIVTGGGEATWAVQNSLP